MVQLEDRLRRYGGTLERAITTHAGSVPTQRPAIAPRQWRRPAAAVAAALVVVATAVVIAIAVPSSDRQQAGRRSQPPHVPSLGIHQIWPGPELTGVDRSSPTTAVSAFIEDVSGELPTSVVPDSTAAPNSPTSVEVSLSSGASVRVIAVPDEQGWGVPQIGENLIAVDGSGSVLSYDPPADGGEATVFWRDDEGTHGDRVSGAQLLSGQVPIRVVGSVASAVLVVRDDTGAVIGILGGHFTPPSAEERVQRAMVRVLVLNAGQPAGAATNLSNQLRTLGYNVLPAANSPVRTATAVQCRPGFETASAFLALEVGSNAQVEQFVEPDLPGAPVAGGADCLVYMGTA